MHIELSWLILSSCGSIRWIIFRSGRHQEALLELQALPPEVASMASLGAWQKADTGDQKSRRMCWILLDEWWMMMVNDGEWWWMMDLIFFLDEWWWMSKAVDFWSRSLRTTWVGEVRRSGRGIGVCIIFAPRFGTFSQRKFPSCPGHLWRCAGRTRGWQYRLLKCKNDVVLQRTMKSKCKHRSVLRRIWNGFQQRTAMVPPVHASQVPNHFWSLCRMYR